MTDKARDMPTPGVTRTSAASLREGLSRALEELAREKKARAQAEHDARTLAHYINSRIDLPVWGHEDVVAMVLEAATRPISGMLRALDEAERKGLAPTYALLREVIRAQAERGFANVRERLEKAGEGGMAAPHLMTEKAKEELGRCLRLPEGEDGHGQGGSRARDQRTGCATPQTTGADQAGGE